MRACDVLARFTVSSLLAKLKWRELCKAISIFVVLLDEDFALSLELLDFAPLLLLEDLAELELAVFSLLLEDFAEELELATLLEDFAELELTTLLELLVVLLEELATFSLLLLDSAELELATSLLLDEDSALLLTVMTAFAVAVFFLPSILFPSTVNSIV